MNGSELPIPLFQESIVPIPFLTMSGDPIVLSAQALERCSSVGANDFVMSGNGFEVHCTAFQAAFISRRVEALLFEDSTVDLVVIESGMDGIDVKRILGLIRDLMNGLSIRRNGDDVEGLLGVAGFLENTELMTKLIDEGPMNHTSG
jgi:hypothetical protein